MQFSKGSPDGDAGNAGGHWTKSDDGRPHRGGDGDSYSGVLDLSFRLALSNRRAHHQELNIPDDELGVRR
eukprot:682562-Alexandrium_andersonii.AAC.1